MLTSYNLSRKNICKALIMVTPCPCMSLQRGTVIVATVDIVLNIISLILFILALIGILALDPASHDQPGKIKAEKTQLIIIFVVLAIIVCLCQIALAIYLRRSAHQKFYHGCKKWLITITILLIFGIVRMGIQISAAANALDIIASVIGIVYRLYTMAVVYCFIRELASGGIPNYYSNAAVSVQ